MEINVVEALIFRKEHERFKLLILTRSQHVKKFPGFQDLPGGKVDAGEDLIDALIREIKEETQLSINKIELLTLHIWPELDNPTVQYKEYVFCTYASDIRVKLNLLEHSSFRWIATDQINETSLHPGMKQLLLAHQDAIVSYTKNITRKLH